MLYFSKFRNISLSLHKNSLSGPLPSFQNLSSLQSLYLDSNSFSLVPPISSSASPISNPSPSAKTPTSSHDEFPTYLTESTNLVSFLASNASLSGAIPDIFASRPNFQNLKLFYNNLTGTLPLSFFASEIHNLRLNNLLRGLSDVIDVLSNMTQLSQAWLHLNAFSGPILDPSKCDNLFDLQLHVNCFTSVVPPSLITLPKLVNITLQNNNLQRSYTVLPPGVDARG